MLSVFTLLGDARLLLPGSVALFAWLRFRGDHKGAAAWLVTLAVCIAMTVGAKLLFYKCGLRIGGYRLSSPSGHMSLAITFFGCCTLLWITGQRMVQSLALIGVAIVAAALLGYSRVALRTHSFPEVLVGAMIGVGCLVLFSHLRVRRDLPGQRLTPIVLGLAVGGTALAVWQSSAEPAIRALAFSHNFSTGLCRLFP